VIVEIRLFAVARQIAGADSIKVDLPEGATVAELRATIATRHPELAVVLRHAMFAVNTDYAADDAVIPPRAEVACIPPVSGG
jgi:molybdopterin converting factor subunit 1